ncbi:MAG: transposase [Bacteroidota bacterium]
MIFEYGKYYHLYNRTNNKEKLFPQEENHLFFLLKFQTYLSLHCSVIAYCLMPTHFHFLIRIESNDTLQISKSIGVVLRSYTRAINKRFDRNGNLFQQNTKAKEITDERYLFILLNYIHQNPLRARLVTRLEDWKYSSYRMLIDSSAMTDSHGVTVDKKFYGEYFKTSNDFKQYSEELVQSVRSEYWI